MYDRAEERPDRQMPALPAAEPMYSVYFTGSAAGAERLEDAPALALAGRVLAEADTNSAFLFLGDNVGPAGMPEKDKDGYGDGKKGLRKARDRASGERQLDLQLDLVDDYPGTALWLHGDLDWARYRLDGAEAQEDYLKDARGDNVLLPKNACGDPELIELAPGVALLLINSQWFVADWTQFPELNEGCYAQSRQSFRWMLANAAKDASFSHVIVAMHHPMISRGPRGGEHGFVGFFRDGFGGPLTNFFRAKIGTEQDLYAPRMLALRDMVASVFDSHPSVTFVSGHEHLLQFGRYDGHPVVGSGTAYERAPGRVGMRTSFTAGVPGLAEIHYYDNGEAWVRIREADGSPSGKTLFTERLYTLPALEYDGGYELYESGVDSVDFAVQPDYREFGGFYRWLIGENNKDLFTREFRYPVLRLDEFGGGVKVTQRGGGGQTNSLRLEDDQGREYALRSVKKDPSRLLPSSFRVGPLITLTQDVFFTANPFAALTAAEIAEGVDIPHANPQFFYLPAQPALGALNAVFADQLYIIEERPNDEWIGEDGPFGTPDDIDGRDDVQEKITESYKDRIDQEQLVRARLLDLLLGDFDRHDDQWRYAEYKDEETGISSWRVIPRDRDQAMIRIDGRALRIANNTLPALREAQNFDDYQNYPGDFTFQARMLDRRFLNELTREQWLAAARDLKESLTDEEIERAFDAWPAAAREGRKERYVAALKRRRDDLPSYAEAQYRFHAETVDVVGTDDKDRFEVERHGNGDVTVSVYALKKGEKVARYYHRRFIKGETKNVQLFGLRDEDEFVTMGRSRNRGIKIRIVPGPEDDEVITDDRARALRRRTRVYLWPGEDDLELNGEAEVHSTRYQAYNQYDYRNVDYDYGLWLPTLGFNPDDGAKIGVSYQHHHYTYHRHFVQQVRATFATASLGSRIEYALRVEDLAPNLDLGLLAAYQTPSFAINYFGFGNETVQPGKPNSTFRIRQELFGLYPNLSLRHKNHPGGLTWSIGAEGVQLERDVERTLGDIASESPLFETHKYVGTGLRYRFYNADSRSFTRDGIHVQIEANYRHRFDPEPADILSLEGSVAIYQHLWHKAMIGMRVGGGTTQGDYYFYNAQQLGRANLRGYRRERFIGDEVAYVQTDLRQMVGKVFHSRFGVFASFDYGRVWLSELPSDTWHYSYGGGLILRPLGLAVLSLGVHVPEDGSPAQFNFTGGFDF